MGTSTNKIMITNCVELAQNGRVNFHGLTRIHKNLYGVKLSTVMVLNTPNTGSQYRSTLGLIQSIRFFIGQIV